MSFVTGYKQPAGTKASELVGLEMAARYLSAQDKGNNIYRYNYYLQISGSSSVDAIRSQTSEESDSQFSAPGQTAIKPCCEGIARLTSKTVAQLPAAVQFPRRLEV